MPLPDAQVLPGDITADVTNTIFTVATAGRYRLAYHVNTTAAVAVGTRLIIGGVPNAASSLLPVISLSSFSNEIMLDLAAGTTVTLQMYGLVTAATLLSSAAGASLMITRLS